MAKKIVKRRKLRVGRVLFILVVLGGLFFGGYVLVNLPIKNIIIKNPLKADIRFGLVYPNVYKFL